MAESGMTDVNLSAWTDLLAPAKTPKPIIDQLDKAVLAAMHADLKAKLFESGIEGPPARPTS
jgi:tripartite-type tricarboxylate transporter receptor subunit TctC